MKPHTATLVNIGQSLPGDTLILPTHADIGLLAESLLYYDRVYLLSSPAGYAALISWFVKSDRFGAFIGLLRAGIIVPMNYTFITGTFSQGDDCRGLVFTSIINQHTAINKNELAHVLDNKLVRAAAPTHRQYREFARAALSVGIDEPHDGYEDAIRHTENDFFDARRCRLYIQDWLEYAFRIRDRRAPPRADVELVRLEPAHETHFRVSWKLSDESDALLKSLDLELPSPAVVLAEIGGTSTGLHTASKYSCDLWPAPSVAAFSGDKIYETIYATSSPRGHIDRLCEEVNFPDIRHLVNQGTIGADAVLAIRERAGHFREWLQTLDRRDPKAIASYHDELATATRLNNYGKKLLEIASTIIPPVVGSAVGATVAPKLGPIGAAPIGAGANAGSKFLLDLAGKMWGGWKPVMFGSWMEKEIAEYSGDRDRPS